MISRSVLSPMFRGTVRRRRFLRRLGIDGSVDGQPPLDITEASVDSANNLKGMLQEHAQFVHSCFNSFDPLIHFVESG